MSDDALDWTPHFQEGVVALWQGRPDGRLFLFRAIGILLIPFSLAWATCVVVAAGEQLQTPDVFALLGSFSLCAGFFAATSKRAFIAKLAFERPVGSNALRAGLTFWGVGEASFRFRALNDAAQVYDTAKAIKRGNFP